MNIVAESWRKKVHGDPNPMLRLFIKLKRLKAHLRALNVAAFGQIPERVKKKRAKLEELQLIELADGSSSHSFQQL